MHSHDDVAELLANGNHECGGRLGCCAMADRRMCDSGVMCVANLRYVVLGLTVRDPWALFDTAEHCNRRRADNGTVLGSNTRLKAR